jgi:hydroxymethylbilane synthase
MANTASNTIRFGTRGSALARVQTSTVASALQQRFPELEVETEIISTRGDQDITSPLPEIGGKGLFTEELEAALRTGRIDLAVHSLKDLPVDDAPGLTIGACLPREDARDAVISRHDCGLEALAAGAVIGTSSLRRGAQIRAQFPLTITSLRGNVDTRVAKGLDPDGPYDAIILAQAGLNRMGLDVQSRPIDMKIMLPAPGQGAVAVQCRADDEAVLEYLRPLNCTDTAAAVAAERQFLDALGAGCRLPVAAFAEIATGEMTINGLVASVDGTTVVRVTHSGDAADAAQVGQHLAQLALATGAAEILAAID